MDPVLLARIQFAFTAGFHFLFPPITIGMAWIIVWMLGKYRSTGEEFWKQTSRFWIRMFTLTFGVGVATGITMEFEFGTNWAEYSRFVGDIFGAPLAAEAIFSFFLESTFLAVLIFGWNKVSKNTLWFAALMVAIGSTLSAFWIIVANSWMQTPAGFEILEGRAVLTDFWAALFNPSTLPRYFHTVCASITTGAFLVMGVSAWYLLKHRHFEFADKSIRIALLVALATSLIQLGLGHWHGVQITKLQPEKLAAMEGHFETTTHAPLKLFGIPDVENERFYFAIEMPPLLSVLAHGKIDSEVKGLKAFPKDERPPVILPFYSFHFMVMIGMGFILFTLWGGYLHIRNILPNAKTYLKLSMLMFPLATLTNQLGWITAEVGRQPWAVYKVIRTADAISPKVSSGEILFSLFMFGTIYALLLFVWLYALKKLIVTGPPLPTDDGKEVTA